MLFLTFIKLFFGLAGVLVGLVARQACTIVGETLSYRERFKTLTSTQLTSVKWM